MDRETNREKQEQTDGATKKLHRQRRCIPKDKVKEQQFGNAFAITNIFVKKNYFGDNFLPKNPEHFKCFAQLSLSRQLFGNWNVINLVWKGVYQFLLWL